MPHTDTSVRPAARHTMILLAAGVAASTGGITGVATATPDLPPNAEYIVNDDGRESMIIDPETQTSGGSTSATRGSPMVPFGTVPDWQYNVRRAVGVVRIGDLNGDGLNDVFVGHYSSAGFPPYDNYQDQIFFNTGDPENPLPATPGWFSADEVHTGDAQLGDLDGDGSLDVFAVTGGGSFAVARIYYGFTPDGMGNPGGVSTSPGWFANPPRPGWPTAGLLFDIDGDGDLDAVTTNQGVTPDPFRSLHFFRNLGEAGGGLETSPSWTSAAEDLQNGPTAGDWDGDGDLDLAVSKWANWESGIYENIDGANLGTNPAWTTGLTGTDRGAAWGDYDNDGITDLFIGADPTVAYRNAPAGTMTLTYTSNPPFSSPQEIALHDVDNDGDLDLADIHFGDGKIHIYLNDNGVFSSTPSWTYDAPESAGNAFAFGDLNGDGWDDLVVGHAGNTSVRLFLAVPLVSACPCDRDGSQVQDLNDYFAYLGEFLAQLDVGNPQPGSADFDGSGLVDLNDYFGFLGCLPSLAAQTPCP